jgi:hypothetical protein
MINHCNLDRGGGVVMVVVVSNEDNLYVLLPAPWKQYGGVLVEVFEVDEL